MMIKIAPWIALTIVGVAFAIANIVASFVEGDFKFILSNPLEVRIEKDHKPAPTYNFHVKREKTWGAT